MCPNFSAFHCGPAYDMKASVLIPTHNRREYVSECVRRLLADEEPPPGRDGPTATEIIVACDRCSDGTEEALRTEFGGRIMIVRPERAGNCAALNAAIAAASGELAIILDDDMLPECGFVSRSEEH